MVVSASYITHKTPALALLCACLVGANLDDDVCIGNELKRASLLQVSDQFSQRNIGPSISLIEEDTEEELLPTWINALWLGHDLTSTALMAVAKNAKATSSFPSLPDLGALKRTAYVLVGLFDTGTNLFEEMVNSNFPSVLNRQLLWKHTLTGAQAITTFLENDVKLNQPLHETVLVVMVRRPLSNLVSLRKAPYNLEFCFHRSWHDYAKPCRGFVSDLESDPPDGLHHGTEFISSMDVYNRYMQQYFDLQKDGKFKEVLFVNYEDLVLDPEAVMQTFAKAIGAEMPPSIGVLTLPAKDHGYPHGREEALLKIKNKAYMAAFNGDELAVRAVCNGLNMALIANFTEGSYRKPDRQRPYSADCSEVLKARPL